MTLFSPRSRYQATYASMDSLVNLSRTKLTHLYNVVGSSSRDNRDLLRKGILIQNALDWGMIERERGKRRKAEKSVFSPRRSVKGTESLSSLWRGSKFESGMDALFEDDEDEEEEDDRVAPSIVTSRASKDTVTIVDPSEYAQTEGEEAWFEQTWNELQCSEGTGSNHHNVHVEVYSIDDDDSMYSSSVSSRTTSPSPPPSDRESISFIPPPTPRLRATVVADKLDGPMEIGTLAPSLECAVPVDLVLAQYDILEDDDEEEEDDDDDDIDIIMDLNQAAPPFHTTTTINHNNTTTTLAAFDQLDVDDVPDFDTDDSDDERDVSSPAQDPLLITPTEDVMDDFGSDSLFEDSYGSLDDDELGGMREDLFATTKHDRARPSSTRISPGIIR